MTVKTRFPPSPTGFLHIGSLRTALYNFLYAKKHGGTMLLRIEDTDRERFVPGAIEGLIRTLATESITYDEGPFLEGSKIVQKGDQSSYLQSERLPLYKKYVLELVASGHAYYCFCSKERLDELRKIHEASKTPTKYDRHCLTLSKEVVEQNLASGISSVIRLHIPEGETVIHDVIRGDIKINHAELDDQVLLKSDGFPTYHLAVVVDDHAMDITHIIRGEEWLSSTPKHILLYKAFGWDIPQFAHLPLILNPDRSKLSKRQGDVAVEDYLAKGYLPEALVNFVALIGFNPKADQELYSMQELIDSFDLEKVNKSGGVFNIEKLNWMNGEYIKRKSEAELAALLKHFLEKESVTVPEPLLMRIIAVEKPRLTTLAEFPARAKDYVEPMAYEPSLLIWKQGSAAEAKGHLEGVLAHLATLPDATFHEIPLLEAAILQYIGGKGLKNGPVLWPLRVALSGKSASPSPFELLWIFGREEANARIQKAMALLT